MSTFLTDILTNTLWFPAQHQKSKADQCPNIENIKFTHLIVTNRNWLMQKIANFE